MTNHVVVQLHPAYRFIGMYQHIETAKGVARMAKRLSPNADIILVREDQAYSAVTHRPSEDELIPF